MASRHKVFVSYHHANDESYKRVFELRFGNKFGAVIPGAVGIGDIASGLKDETIRQKIRDEFLRDTSVTVVLIGTETWTRKHVDWEISSSLRNTALNPRSGVLGLFLPSHPAHGADKYERGLIPPRLYDNAKRGYALLYDWTNEATSIHDWVHRAYLKKLRVDPDNSRPMYRRNRTGTSWA